MKKLLIFFSLVLMLAFTAQVNAQTNNQGSSIEQQYGPEWDPYQPGSEFNPGPDYDNFQPDAPQSWLDRFIDRLLGGAI